MVFIRPRAVRTVVTALVTVVGAVAAGPHAVVAACWHPPVTAPVSDPFRPPSCRWCPGNRGLEYDTVPGQRVTAVESGRVSFAGSVAGTVYVVVDHRDGRRVTYGRLADRRFGQGELVLRGQIVGTTGETFHFGVRTGEQYLDPALSIGRLVGRPRLVPADGSPAAPAPPPLLRCGSPAVASKLPGRDRSVPR